MPALALRFSDHPLLALVSILPRDLFRISAVILLSLLIVGCSTEQILKIEMYRDSSLTRAASLYRKALSESEDVRQYKSDFGDPEALELLNDEKELQRIVLFYPKREVKIVLQSFVDQGAPREWYLGFPIPIEYREYRFILDRS